MGKVSVKEDKSIYQIRREELGLSRDKASEVLETMSPERIERIENGKLAIHPDEVLQMSKGYKMPNLCNYYCANECSIGKEYVPEVKVKDLSQIVLEMVASLNSMKKKQERLIEITADGVIDDEEIEDFVAIQQELEHISITVETLKMWSAQMLANSKINMDLYNKYKDK